MSTIPSYPPPTRSPDGTELVPMWQDGQQTAASLAIVGAQLAQSPSIVAVLSQPALTAQQQAAIATAEALTAQQGAADSGAYLNAVKALTGNSPLSAALTIQAASRAILAAIAGPTAGTQAYLGETGREGVFQWRTDSYAAQVAADPLQALYVAPASQPDGSAGVWRRVRTRGAFNVMWYGATGDGVTDDTVSIQTAMNAAAARGGGGVLFPQPPVKYLCNGAFQDTQNSNAILLLPAIPNVPDGISLALLGEYPVSTTTGTNSTDIIIETTNAGPGTLMGRTMPGGGASYVNLTIAGICLRTPVNGNVEALDARCMRNTFLPNLRIDKPRWSGATRNDYSIDIPLPTNGLQDVGIRTPNDGVATTCRFGNVYIAGYAYGAILGELTEGDLVVVGCRTAIGTNTGSHPSRMNISMYNCANQIECLGALEIHWNLKLEQDTAAGSGPLWVETARRGYVAGQEPTITDGYSIHDPGSNLIGSVFHGDHDAFPFSVVGGNGLEITALPRLGGTLGGGYGPDQPFAGFGGLANRSSYRAINGFGAFKPWHLLNGQTTTPGDIIAAWSAQNYVGNGPDFRAIQIATLVGATVDDAYAIFGIRSGGGLVSAFGIRPSGIRLELPDAHIDTANQNNDAAGGLTLANASSFTKQFSKPYTSAAAPVVTLAPAFDLGAGVRCWYSPVGSPGTWTGFTVNTSAPVSGSFGYHVMGNGA